MLVYNVLHYVFSWGGGGHEISPLLNGGGGGTDLQKHTG